MLKKLGTFYLVLLLALLMPTRPLLAQEKNHKPKNIQLDYEVTRDGQAFAKVRENFTQDGQHYQIKSTTKGLGIYALFGVRQMISEGDITPAGLKPKHFELHQGDNKSKTLVADFDWANSKLTMQVKGESMTEPLTAGTQDLASYAYQFMFKPPADAQVVINLTTGKKLNQYVYNKGDDSQLIDVGQKSYTTITLTTAQSNNGEKKQIWLAKDQFYLPIKYQIIDEKGVNLTQTLINIHVE